MGSLKTSLCKLTMRKKNKRVSLKRTVSQRPEGITDRHSYPILGCVLIIALVLRILALLSLKDSIYFDFLLWDERVYHVWAMKIARGIHQSTSVYEFSPLPAYLMALIYKIFSPDISYIRVLNIILGVLTCYLIYLIAKELANRTIGLAACLIAALYKPFIFYSIVPLKTSLSVFLFAMTIYFFVAVLNKYSMITLCILGIAAGFMLNVRPNFVVVNPLILLITLLSIPRERNYQKSFFAALILFIGGLSISISPFVVRNYRVSGKFALTTSQAGFNLYLGNNLQNPDPYYRPVPFASSSPFKQGVQFTIEASRRMHKKLFPQEASSYWSREVLKIALEQPAAFMWKLFQKTLAFFNQFEAGDHYHIGFISDFVGFFKFPFLRLWLILPFGMAGMAVSCMRSKKFFALCSTFLLYALTLIIFFTTTRYRLPLLVILIPFAVIGINCLAFFIKNKQFKHIAIYASIAIAFFIVEFLPVRGTNDTTAYYNTHAIILESKGFKDEAVEYWGKSSRMNMPFSAFANLALAGSCFVRGDTGKAISCLNKIPENSFAAASKHEMMGDILVQQGHIKKATGAYQRSLAINSGQRRPRLKLIRIYDNVDRERALQEKERFKYISSFYTII